MSASVAAADQLSTSSTSCSSLAAAAAAPSSSRWQQQQIKAPAACWSLNLRLPCVVAVGDAGASSFP
jgi:hypothetical protein